MTDTAANTNRFAQFIEPQQPANRFVRFAQQETVAPVAQAQPEVAEAPEPEVRQGSFLPFRATEEGGIEFDPSAGVLGAIVDAVTLPGDVVQGNVDLSSPEGISRTANLAGLASPLPAASRVAFRGAQSAARPRQATAEQIDAAAQGLSQGVARPKLRSAQELEAAASAAYQRADDAGLVLTEAGFSRAAERMLNALRKDPATGREVAFSPRLHPRIQAAVNEIGDRVGQPQSLTQVDVLRQIVAEAGKSTSRSERRLARNMVDELDSFMSNLAPRNVRAGDPQAAVTSLMEGRRIWSIASRTRTIDDLFDRAATDAGNFSGSGFENALRRQFVSLAKNDRRLRTFSKPEQAAIKRVARGTTPQRLARFAGRFAPTGVVSTGFGIGSIAVNPGLAVVPAIGAAGRVAATRMGMRNVRKLQEQIQRGEPQRRSMNAINRTRRLLNAIGRRPITTGQAVGGALEARNQ